MCEALDLILSSKENEKKKEHKVSLRGKKKKKSQNQRQTWSDSKNSEPFALKPV